jgi:carboxyl-terminal processing protease
MVARALQRSGRATLVGERTAGAVLGGSAFLLDDGAILYLAVRDVLVDGERLEGVGVQPDRIVPDDLRYAAGRDRQRDAAIEVAVTIARAGNRTNSHHSLEHSHDATGSPFHRFDD